MHWKESMVIKSISVEGERYRLCNLLHEYCAQLRGWNWKADEAFGATHKATYRDVGNAMNHEYTDAAVEQRESHEDESQDWDLLFVGLAC